MQRIRGKSAKSDVFQIPSVRYLVRNCNNSFDSRTSQVLEALCSAANLLRKPLTSSDICWGVAQEKTEGWD